MHTVYSSLTNLAYFKYEGALFSVPFNLGEQELDLDKAYPVDYFSLTTEEFENAMETLNLLEQYDEV